MKIIMVFHEGRVCMSRVNFSLKAKLMMFGILRAVIPLSINFGIGLY